MPEPMPLTALLTTDYAGITRGRAIPTATYEADPDRASTGWVPANLSLTPFDVIADPNPWGSRGDLRLKADPQARYRTAIPGATTPFDCVMADIVALDGAPWPPCARGLLKAALADLEAVSGLRLVCAFEHEFQILDAGFAPAPAFGLFALRRADPLGPVLAACLDEAGIAPETIIAEYGRDQIEITSAPADALVAADRAVATREIVREVALRSGYRASFAPKTEVDGVGNGVHVHMSLVHPDGRPASFDPAREGRLSAPMGAFLAGILRRAPALVALTAPAPISYLRLSPHHWSAAWTWLGDADREATLRICPTTTMGGRDPARQFNVEYRAADACACPHLALAMLVRAGVEGLRGGLPTPPIVDADPLTLDEGERARLGLARLPGSLREALAALEADPVASAFLPPAALETYLGMKRAELALAGEALDDALCARYAAIY
ncbi:glutamine synthetase [Salinarimonas chemoclinalis]|uniref:glutamine synthetase n=1 Tax=Salinarimonas chemoclinalis TaxID=3241599 RepID=UPI0035578C9F